MKLGTLFVFQIVHDANLIFKTATSIGLLDIRISIFGLLYHPVLIVFAAVCMVYNKGLY